MDRDTAVARIKQRLGFRTDLTTEARNALQDAQAEFESRPQLPWWLQTEWSTGGTTSGEHRVALPTDFLQPVDEAHLFYKDSDGNYHRLRKEDLDYLQNFYNDEPSGAPKQYALLGLNLYIYPLPDASYSLRYMYYAADQVLTSNIENKWLKYAPRLMIAEACALLGADIQHPNVQLFAAESERLWQRALFSTIARATEGDTITIED